MMLLPTGTSVRIHIAEGVTNIRKGMDGLAMLVQNVLRDDPFSGRLFAFRGRKANLIKIVFWAEWPKVPPAKLVERPWRAVMVCTCFHRAPARLCLSTKSKNAWSS